MIPEYRSNARANVQVSGQVMDISITGGSTDTVQIHGASLEQTGLHPNHEPASDTDLTQVSEIHDRTSELESRVSVLEEELTHREYDQEEYEPNISFQNAVKQSLVDGGVLQDPDIKSELASRSVEWEDISPETQSQIKRTSLEPVHDLAVLLGVIVSILATVGSLLVGFHLLSLIFLIMAAFLYYSYQTGLGE